MDPEVRPVESLGTANTQGNETNGQGKRLGCLSSLRPHQENENHQGSMEVDPECLREAGTYQKNHYPQVGDADGMY